MRILQQFTMFFLKKNYIVKFSTSSIFKKINKDIFETKKFKKKIRRKKKKSILGKKKHVKKNKSKKKKKKKKKNWLLQ